MAGVPVGTVRGMPEPDLTIHLDPMTGHVEWRSGRIWLGHHLTVVPADTADPGTIVLHSRGYQAGPHRDRIYVPAAYHVFAVIRREPDGLLALRQVASFGSVLRRRRGGPDATEIPWRPYPDPARTNTNGHGGPPTGGDPLMDGPTTLN